jgi:hypothetical protein
MGRRHGVLGGHKARAALLRRPSPAHSDRNAHHAAAPSTGVDRSIDLEALIVPDNAVYGNSAAGIRASTMPILRDRPRASGCRS